MNRILGPRLGYGQMGLIINSPLVKIVDLYRVTQNVGQNLLLTSNQKFRFGLARPGQAKPSQNGTFVLNVNRRFWPTFCVTLYSHCVKGHGHGADEDVCDGEGGDEEVGGLPDLAVDDEADEDEEVAEGGDDDADGQAHRDEDGQQGAEGRRPALGAAGSAVGSCKNAWFFYQIRKNIRAILCYVFPHDFCGLVRAVGNHCSERRT